MQSIFYKYPNLRDMDISPCWAQPLSGHKNNRTRLNNRWMNFWNLTGARLCNGNRHCIICNAIYRNKSRKSRLPLCSNHLHSFIRQKTTGKIRPEYQKILQEIKVCN